MAIQTDEISAGIVQYIIDEVPNGLDKSTPFLKYVMTDGKKKRDVRKEMQKIGTEKQFSIRA